MALIPTREGLYFSSDTPLKQNHVYHFDRQGELRVVGDLDSSSIYGCSTSEAIFFSTMVEPSEVNPTARCASTAARMVLPGIRLSPGKKMAGPCAFFSMAMRIFPMAEYYECARGDNDRG